MAERLEATQEVDRSSVGEQGSLGRELFGSLTDIKAIFGTPSKDDVAAVDEHFGELLLFDDSAPPLVSEVGARPGASRDRLDDGKAVAEDRPLEISEDSLSRRVIPSRNGDIEIDEDGEVRRGTLVDEDGLRARELEIPKGNTPLVPKDEGPGNPEDRFVEIDNQRRPEEKINFENIGGQVDEDGGGRVFVVDEDGRRTREVTS